MGVSFICGGPIIQTHIFSVYRISTIVSIGSVVIHDFAVNRVDMDSNSEKEEAKVAKALGLEKVVPEIYKDLFQPATKEFGRSLKLTADAVNLALAPIQGLIWGGETIRDYITVAVTKRLKDLPPKQIVYPKPSVAGPAIEALRFFGSESKLRGLFANLLASAMDTNTASTVHPAFVEIIKQLSPEEALILSYIAKLDSFPRISKETIANIRGMTATEKASKAAFSKMCRHIEGVKEKDAETYLDNLRRLQLLEITYTFEDELGALYGDDRLWDENIIEIIEATREREEEVRVTALGSLFIRLCVEND